MFKSRSQNLEKLLPNQPKALKWAKKINRQIKDEQATIGIIRKVAEIRASPKTYKDQCAELEAEAKKISKEKLSLMNPFKRLLVGSDLKYNIMILGYSAPKLMEGQQKELK